MVDFHRLKNLGTDIIGRASDIAEQAKDKVGPLAEQAKDKVVPLAGKAKDVATKGVDKAAGGLDSATGHKYHDKLGGVAGNREKLSGDNADLPAPPRKTDSDDPGEGIAADQTEAVDQIGTEPTAEADTGTPEAGTAGDHPLDTGTPEDATGLAGAATVDESAHDAADRPPTPADMPPHPPAHDAS